MDGVRSAAGPGADAVADGEEPGRVVTPEALFLVAVAAAAIFVAVLLIEGGLRAGYDPTYHTVSELELGRRGWVQRFSFLVMGLGSLAFAAGVRAALGSDVAAALLAVFGFGMLVAGLFVPDAVRGYPPGAPSEAVGPPTVQHRIHHVLGGPVPFLAIFGACLTLAIRLPGAWQVYSGLTALVGLAMTVWTVRSYQADAPRTGLVQRGLLLVYWTWIMVMGLGLGLGLTP